jgi:hypothetical protein
MSVFAARPQLRMAAQTTRPDTSRNAKWRVLERQLNSSRRRSYSPMRAARSTFLLSVIAPATVTVVAGSYRANEPQAPVCHHTPEYGQVARVADQSPAASQVGSMSLASTPPA